MPSWREVEQAAGDLAKRVRDRFEAHGLGLLATLRPSGFPRISGIEPLFQDQLWLGMMPQSRKALDLLSDPRLALHSATEDKNVRHGDARITGLGAAVEDDVTIGQFRDDVEAHTGLRPPEGPIHVFRVDVTEISFLSPGGDHLLIEWWTSKDGVRSTKRR